MCNALFKNTGEIFSRCGHEAQNHLGIGPVLAVETMYPKAKGCCKTSSRSSGSSCPYLNWSVAFFGDEGCEMSFLKPGLRGLPGWPPAASQLSSLKRSLMFPMSISTSLLGSISKSSIGRPKMSPTSPSSVCSRLSWKDCVDDCNN